MNEEEPTRRKLFIAEMCGTGLLLLVGLSSVIFMFADGSPFVALVPSLTLSRVLNGFLFGSVGASIALSPLGKTIPMEGFGVFSTRNRSSIEDS